MPSLLNLILTITLLAAISSGANFHCIDILDQYFSCRHLHPINLVKNPPYGPADWYVFNGTLDDVFFQRTLRNSSRFETAMDMFRHIALENGPTCTSKACNCTRSNSIDMGKVYQFYFLNATYFPQIKALIANATRNYTLLTPLQIYSRTGQFFALFDATIYSEVPTLVQFCLANDFTFNRIYNYQETYECYAQAYLRGKENQFECEWAYMMFADGGLAILNKTRANFSVLESYYSCRLAPLVNAHKVCPLNIQRFIALNYVKL